MSILELYLLSTAFKLAEICIIYFIFVGMLFLVGAAISIVAWEDIHEPIQKRFLRMRKKIGLSLVLAGLIIALTPTKEQAAWIAGGYVVTNAEGIGELPQNVVDAANRFLTSIKKEE